MLVGKYRWTGGPYGVGTRMRIPWTRRMLHAALDGELDNVAFETDPIFNLSIPCEVPDIPSEILQPQNTWADSQLICASNASGPAFS